MEEKNELNDIILNKNSEKNNSKKFILAIAGLGIAIIVVILYLMNSKDSNSQSNLPHVTLPPKHIEKVTKVEKEPLFEDVEVVQEDNIDKDNLDQIAKQLKEETKPKDEAIQKEQPKSIKPKKVQKQQKIKKEVKKTVHKKALKTKVAVYGHYYVQVGSFSKYEPNKKFLKSIKDLGYKYRYHQVKKITKVVVGPFKTKADANNAKKELRSKVEAGSFVVKI